MHPLYLLILHFAAAGTNHYYDAAMVSVPVTQAECNRALAQSADDETNTRSVCAGEADVHSALTSYACTIIASQLDGRHLITTYTCRN